MVLLRVLIRFGSTDAKVPTIEIINLVSPLHFFLKFCYKNELMKEKFSKMIDLLKDQTLIAGMRDDSTTITLWILSWELSEYLSVRL